MESRQRGGWTLTEVLTVIAILVILAAILLSLLPKSKEEAQVSVCSERLHHAVSAVLLYMPDNDDCPPPSLANVAFNSSYCPKQDISYVYSGSTFANQGDPHLFKQKFANGEFALVACLQHYKNRPASLENMQTANAHGKLVMRPIPTLGVGEELTLLTGFLDGSVRYAPFSKFFPILPASFAPPAKPLP